MSDHTYKPGQAVVWFKETAKGRGFLMSRKRTPATFVEWSESGKKMRISVTGDDGKEEIVTVMPAWVEPAKAQESA